MMYLRLLLTTFFISFSAQSVEWPQPNPDNCKFYDELEANLQCKSQDVNYLSDYAPYYCREFRKRSPNWTAPLQSWVKKTDACLQTKLYEHKSNSAFTCETLEKEAFKIHAKCYNQADFCQLKVSDLYQVFKVIKLRDFWKEFRYSDGGMTRLISYCIKENLLK